MTEKSSDVILIIMDSDLQFMEINYSIVTFRLKGSEKCLVSHSVI